MTRQEAAEFTRHELNKHSLQEWGVRLNQNADSRFLGLCSYRDKVIILSAHHIDIHPTVEVQNTIRHEIAHALVGPNNGHNEIWATKAREIGCDNTLPCSHLSLDPSVIDAIRSGATVEVTFEEQVIRTPKFNITRLQDKCEDCGKVAKSLWEETYEADDFHPDIKVVELECGHFIVRNIPKGTPFHTMQFGGDESCEHEWGKNLCLKCMRARPYEFQLDGMRFGEAALSVNNGVGIFDEMGLGKTIQAMGVVKFHPELCTPTLWVVKSGLKYQFAMAIYNWMGDEHLPQIVETSKDFLMPGFKNYIIGYDMLVPKVRQMKSGKVAVSGFDISQFERVGIKCVVLDECQQIKNVDSSRTQMVRRVVKGRKVIALSGTPWKNRGSELFPVLNMLDPVKFYSEEGFKNQWVDYWYQGSFRKEAGIKNIQRFREHIKDIVIRRERTEVLPELPLVNRTKLYVKMDLQQEKVYDEAVQKFVEWYEEQAANISGMHILAAMQKMRHLVAIAKIPATIEYVDEFVEDTDRKLVIFVHHIDVGEMLLQKLKDSYGADMPVMHVVGGMDGMKRHLLVEKFNSSPRALMVASTLSSGEGLNLQTGSDCILHERQWNPANEEQVEGRFIRIGASASKELGGSGYVNAIYPHLEGMTTIDPQLDAINERKRRQFHTVHNKSEMPIWNQDSMMKELADLIVTSHYAKTGRKKAS